MSLKGGSKNEGRKLDEGREALVEKVRLKGGIWMKDENNGGKEERNWERK